MITIDTGAIKIQLYYTISGNRIINFMGTVYSKTMFVDLSNKVLRLDNGYNNYILLSDQQLSIFESIWAHNKPDAGITTQIVGPYISFIEILK